MTSSLSIYQRGERSGFCEFSTSVETEMAKLDEDKPPPEGLVARAGYQIHLNGNTSLGDFTNRLRFDGRLQFSARRQWRELTLKLSTRNAMVEIHSFATNQTVHLKITNDDGISERDFAFADLASPGALLRRVRRQIRRRRAAGHARRCRSRRKPRPPSRRIFTGRRTATG